MNPTSPIWPGNPASPLWPGKLLHGSGSTIVVPLWVAIPLIVAVVVVIAIWLYSENNQD